MKKDGITPEMKRQLKKLVEAALTMTIRMRLTACKDFTEDMLRASIRWSEAVRMRFTVSADTFLDLVDKVLAIPGLDFSTALKLEKGLGMLGITYQNTPIAENKCMAILSLKPFVKDARSASSRWKSSSLVSAITSRS